MRAKKKRPARQPDTLEIVWLSKNGKSVADVVGARGEMVVSTVPPRRDKFGGRVPRFRAELVALRAPEWNRADAKVTLRRRRYLVRPGGLMVWSRQKNAEGLLGALGSVGGE